MDTNNVSDSKDRAVEGGIGEGDSTNTVEHESESDNDADNAASIQVKNVVGGNREADCRPVSPWRHCYPWIELIDLPNDEIANDQRVTDTKIRHIRARNEEAKREASKPDSSSII
jgi:hypothetical protein